MAVVSQMDRSRKTFMLLATIIGWGGFVLSHQIDFHRQEKETQRFQEQWERRKAEQARWSSEVESLQRELGCKGEVLMGICMDPPCIDSDASGPLDQSHIRGSVKSYVQMTRHQVIEDECIDTSDLREGTCKLDIHGGAAEPEWVVIHCDKGCRDGACIR